ncbi:hypothetical protein [Pedobacter caeni]|uniref:Tetratricopeptide repeat-containing protein n=1 Tax=Pedobacter caeni TaxID=288992 RepID=A0A1M5BYB9_9SPHI|nr:hypothetical protein [Pedobacter caeni]SHF47524.1 hypothetical protein SAMN04488522_1021411 [Pedobacter caeni]
MNNHLCSTFFFSKKYIKKFLLIFSLCLLSVTGVVWACSDGDYDDSEYSNFSPESFVATQYSPFFYTSYYHYYGSADDDNNARYNAVVTAEWNTYLKSNIDLKSLLFKSDFPQIDSVLRYFKGKIKVLPKGIPDVKSAEVNQKLMGNFLAYLQLAKLCEIFAVKNVNYWEESDQKNAMSIPTGVLNDLARGFNAAPDQFIKQRIWFQIIRYYYFDSTGKSEQNATENKRRVVKFFDAFKNIFPKNITYYRAMGYVAGFYYRQKDFATANYLYSLAYNFSAEMKIPNNWSFHPQEESDWQQSLKMAKDKEEQITLWQMLGINSDAPRAIEQIYSLNPKSEKLDLLLSRLVNISESTLRKDTAHRKSLRSNTELLSKIALKNNTNKPFFWNLAAGYLNTMTGNYTLSKAFYNKAKTQLPKNDKLIVAQYKILDWILYLSQLKKIDARAENDMTGSINWLADLKEGKDSIGNLRFKEAVAMSTQTLSVLYLKQSDLVKANCFQSSTAFYADHQNIEALKALMIKPKKTPFEVAMLRYYHLSMDDLEYHQALMLVYKDKINEAVVLMDKSGKNALFKLPGNPFISHIYDCHDCDFASPQKKKYTPLSFVKTMQAIKTEITVGKNVYNNAYLLANAFYNITYYGNARTFYENAITNAELTSTLDLPPAFRQTFTSGKLAEKYYLLARANAANAEQKAKCTYMASKCERNEVYNSWYRDQPEKLEWGTEGFGEIPKGRYFAELKSEYHHTKYYQEILQECGYFKKYANK